MKQQNEIDYEQEWRNHLRILENSKRPVQFAPVLAWDGSIVRPSKIPGEFKLVMTQEMKDYQKILRETMFEHHRSH